MSAPRQNGDAPSRRNIAGKAASLARTRTPAGAQESAHGKHGKRRTRSLCLRQCSEGGRRAGQASARAVRPASAAEANAATRRLCRATKDSGFDPRKAAKKCAEECAQARREKCRQSRIRQGFRRRFRHPERTPEPAASGSPGERGMGVRRARRSPAEFRPRPRGNMCHPQKPGVHPARTGREPRAG